MQFFDTHAHYSDKKFEEIGGVTNAANEAAKSGVKHIMLASTDIDDTITNINLAKTLSNSEITFYIAAGIHPESASLDNFNIKNAGLEKLSALVEKKCEKIKAIGEIGLDYYWDKREETKKAQKELFILQLQIANNSALPVVVHNRNAHEDTMKILKEHSKTPVILHSFSGSLEMCRQAVSNGYFISMSGVVTFKNARVIVDVAKQVPMEHLLIETDAPYLTPHPYRGKCNSSAYLPLIAEKIAQIKEIPIEQIAQFTTNNAKKFFKL